MSFPKGFAQVAYWKKQKPRKPLRTFKEMAEEFGLKVGQLRVLMVESNCNPPKYRLRQNGASAETWYDPVEMRAWWKRHNEAGKL